MVSDVPVINTSPQAVPSIASHDVFYYLNTHVTITDFDEKTPTTDNQNASLRPLLNVLTVYSVCIADACHTLTCALMLLNTDLHGQVLYMFFLSCV